MSNSQKQFKWTSSSSTKYKKGEKSNHRYGSPEWSGVCVCNEDNQTVSEKHTHTHKHFLITAVTVYFFYLILSVASLTYKKHDKKN